MAKTVAIIIQADRINDTDDERAWLDLVDAVRTLVYSSGNGWHDSINLQMHRYDGGLVRDGRNH